MGAFNHDSFVFTALSDFRAIENPDEQLAKAREFGIRIIDDVDFGPDDWHVVKGPFWRFRRRADKILRGFDNDGSFFIRRVEAAKGSSIKLYYYDLKTQEDAIIEVRRRSGLVLVFRSGRKPHYSLEVHSMCSKDHHLCFLSNGDRFDID